MACGEGFALRCVAARGDNAFWVQSQLQSPDDIPENITTAGLIRHRLNAESIRKIALSLAALQQLRITLLCSLHLMRVIPVVKQRQRAVKATLVNRGKGDARFKSIFCKNGFNDSPKRQNVRSRHGNDGCEPHQAAVVAGGVNRRGFRWRTLVAPIGKRQSDLTRYSLQHAVGLLQGFEEFGDIHLQQKAGWLRIAPKQLQLLVGKKS